MFFFFSSLLIFFNMPPRTTPKDYSGMSFNGISFGFMRAKLLDVVFLMLRFIFITLHKLRFCTGTQLSKIIANIKQNTNTLTYKTQIKYM